MNSPPFSTLFRKYIAANESLAFDVFADAEPVNTYCDDNISLFVQETPDVTIRVSIGRALSLTGWQEDARLHQSVEFEAEQAVKLPEFCGRRQAVIYTRLGAEGLCVGDDGELAVIGSESLRLWDICQELESGDIKVLQNWIVHASQREKYLPLESRFFDSLRLQ